LAGDAHTGTDRGIDEENFWEMKYVVLYAENDEGDLFICERAFKKHDNSINLRSVSDGRSVIDWLDGNGSYGNRAFFPVPQVVVIDSKLGDMTGLDVLRWIRAQRRFKELPVILYCGSTPAHVYNEYEDLGIAAVLEKDSRCDRLIEVIQSIVMGEPVHR
jgi:CheY-like chemotaxis protein